MNKEHLETDLTIKASYTCKIGHILELTYLQIAPFVINRQDVEYIHCVSEIYQDSRSAINFNVLKALL